MDKRITLEQRISRLERLFSVKNEAADEAELVYQDDLWDVYKIMTRKAAKKYGADPTLVCGSGVFKSTPIDKAKFDRRPELVELLQQYAR